MARREAWFRQVIFPRFMRRTMPLFVALTWLWRRLLFRTTFIAVTGAVGKTTTKQLLAMVLRAHGATYETFRNQNGFALMCLNVLRVRPWHRFAVIEVGIDAPGQMIRSARVLTPDAAIVVAMDRTHAKGFRDLAEHAAEKAVLLAHVRRKGFAALYGDDPLVRAMADKSVAPAVLFGAGEGCEYRVSEPSSRWPDRLRFVFRSPLGDRPARTQLVGEHWLPPALAALTAADRLGLDPERSTAALAAAPPVEARLSPYRTPNGAIFLRDDYSAAAPTVEPALRVMAQADARRRILVLSDFSDFEGNVKARRRHLAPLLPGAVDALVLVGQASAYGAKRAVQAGLDESQVHAFDDLWEASRFLESDLGEGDLVLLKGRTTDHVTRLFYAQLGEVGCWKPHCSKRMLCDLCWEMTLPEERRLLATPVPAPEET